MKTIKNRKVAIVGAGPGGLTLATLLQQHGVDVKVYERDENKNARAKGATLDLHEESGLRAIREAGLLDAFWENYRPGADKLRVMDKNAKIVFDDDVHGQEDRSRPEIDRGPLQTILLESLMAGTVIWNRQLVSLSPNNSGWRLEFKNGDYAEADLVVAADGANSKIRSYITPIKPFYCGITVIEGAVKQSEITIPEMHKLLNGGKIFAMGNGQSLIVSSKGDGSLVFYIGFKKDENWSKENGLNFSDKGQIITWFKEEYDGWDEVWLQLFENSEYFVERPQYCMPLDQTWKALPNLTVLGDAAHLMPPYAGEGVNMAMLDALELSICLLSEDFPSLESAIEKYEIQMRKRASDTAKMTLESTDSLHSDNAISFLLDILAN